MSPGKAAPDALADLPCIKPLSPVECEHESMHDRSPATPPADEDMIDEPTRRHRALVEALVCAVEHDPTAASVWPVALPPGTQVRCVQTHISTVLLAGDHALKLKKPVRFPFADFSTLDLREGFCREELRINRRTAPDLYLDVLPITGTRRAPRVGGTGAAIEWGVWMRRFDEAALFDHMAWNGCLSEQHVDALAATVAAFQGAQAAAPEHGDPAQALRWAQDNLSELRDLCDRSSGPLADAASTLARLDAWTSARHAQVATLLARRRRCGAVIEGHGDLHLGNIVWDGGAPLLFDAVEFDVSLRHADRMADIAFVFMDLLDHGLSRWAWRWLSAVLETGGDYDGLPLLRWFAVYRALVRAKVALLGRDAQSGAVATRRIALAEELAWPAAPPLLLLVCGLSGSGKSTVALALVEALGGVRVRSDVERKRLHGLRPTQRVADPSLVYNAASTAQTYARLGEVARAGLAGGVTVVVDAVFNRRDERAVMRRIALEAGVNCVVIDCRASEATMRSRIERRLGAGVDASDADASVLAMQQGSREAPDPAEGDTLIIDTDCPWPPWHGRVEALAKSIIAARAPRPA